MNAQVVAMLGDLWARSAARLAVAWLVALGSPVLAPRAAASGSAGWRKVDVGENRLLAGVTERGGLLLADGREAALAWLDTPPSLLRKRVQAMTEALAATDIVSVQIHGGDVMDRWGRTSVRADISDRTGACVSLQETLLRAGLARLRPGIASEPSLAELNRWRQAEQMARDAGAGLWAEAANRPLPASATTEIMARAGHFTIVEGGLASVNERADRTYLNFGSRWLEDMTVSAPARIWRMMKRDGLTAEQLRAGVVRVRGVVEIRGGPMIELASPAELEVTGTGSRP